LFDDIPFRTLHTTDIDKLVSRNTQPLCEVFRWIVFGLVGFLALPDEFGNGVGFWDLLPGRLHQIVDNHSPDAKDNQTNHAPSKPPHTTPSSQENCFYECCHLSIKRFVPLPAIELVIFLPIKRTMSTNCLVISGKNLFSKIFSKTPRIVAGH
jgi:hypothetical protein